jgi:phage shock protein PspC (stress-responsive transcriptional regulator)
MGHKHQKRFNVDAVVIHRIFLKLDRMAFFHFKTKVLTYILLWIDESRPLLSLRI